MELRNKIIEILNYHTRTLESEQLGGRIEERKIVNESEYNDIADDIITYVQSLPKEVEPKICEDCISRDKCIENYACYSGQDLACDKFEPKEVGRIIDVRKECKESDVFCTERFNDGFDCQTCDNYPFELKEEEYMGEEVTHKEIDEALKEEELIFEVPKEVEKKKEVQDWCKCENQDMGMTLGNSPYCRTCNKWIEPKEVKEELCQCHNPCYNGRDRCLTCGDIIIN